MQKLLTLHLDTTAALETRKANKMALLATPIEQFKALVRDHLKKKFDETIFVWWQELLLVVLLNPCAKCLHWGDVRYLGVFLPFFAFGKARRLRR